jgi:hypothetical protein
MSTYASRALNIRATLEDAEATSAQARSDLEAGAVTDALSAIHTARITLDDAEHLAVALLRTSGSPWQAIADALGTTRQAAHERFSRDLV